MFTPFTLLRLGNSCCHFLSSSEYASPCRAAHLAHGRSREAERSLHRAEDAYGQLHLQTETGYANLALGYLSPSGTRRIDFDGLQSTAKKRLQHVVSPKCPVRLKLALIEEMV
jgi:hypothetical protein